MIQSNLAQAEVARFRGAVDGRHLEDLCAASTIIVEQRFSVRMAATHAIHKAREAIAYAGAPAIFENHQLERRFRYIHTVTQQLEGWLSQFETVGASMMGADAQLTFV